VPATSPRSLANLGTFDPGIFFSDIIYLPLSVNMSLDDASVSKKSRSKTKLKSKEAEPDSATAVLPIKGVLQFYLIAGSLIVVVDDNSAETPDDEARRKEEKRKKKKERKERKEKKASAIAVTVDENAMTVDSECMCIYPVNIHLVNPSYPTIPNSAAI
jgi:hypothetical protein